MSGSIVNSAFKAANKKQVRFGFVETRYYQRSIGYITNKPGIKLGSCYKPFTTTKTYFREHDTSTCIECVYKRGNLSKPYINKNDHTKRNEKLNKFYNIHGEANHMIKRCSRDYRIDILLESGICVQCLIKALIIQFNYLEFLYKNIIKEHNIEWSKQNTGMSDYISERENIKILNEHDIQVQKIVISSVEELKRLDNMEDNTPNLCHICSERLEKQNDKAQKHDLNLIVSNEKNLRVSS